MSEHSARFEAAYRYRASIQEAIAKYRCGLRLAWKQCPVLDHPHLRRGMEWEWRLLRHRFLKSGQALDQTPVVLDMEAYNAFRNWFGNPMAE